MDGSPVFLLEAQYVQYDRDELKELTFAILSLHFLLVITRMHTTYAGQLTDTNG